jgi:hypothetical protein
MNYRQHPRFTPPPAKSVVAPLPRQRRRFLFLSLVTLFVCAVPVFVFYATGYRYDIFAPYAPITATGGLYISVASDEGEVFLNEERVEDSRIFRSALYIQNLTPGLQRVHVQAAGYHTWVKELPVYPHIVTEASAFMMPLVPQIRPISQYVLGNTPVYLGVPSTTTLFSFASTSVPILATTSRATTTLTLNTEYTYVRNLFTPATATATSTTPLINRVVDEARGIFDTAESSTTSTSTEQATTTPVITERDMTLQRRGDDVVVRYIGSERSIPYYFCIPDDIVASTSARYEAQVIAARQALAEEIMLEEGLETTTTAERECRREIVLDRQGAEIISFAFFPGTTDLVLVHRTDGIFVTEVDDRAWQNTQRLYPGTADAMVLDGGRIYVEDKGYYLELFTELPTSS